MEFFALMIAGLLGYIAYLGNKILRAIKAQSVATLGVSGLIIELSGQLAFFASKNTINEGEYKEISAVINKNNSELFSSMKKIID